MAPSGDDFGAPVTADAPLKPCPFCGGVAELFTHGPDGGTVVGCKDCQAQTRVWWSPRPGIVAIVTAAWNKRVTT